MRYGGSYAPYFGNLYGPPQVVTAPPYYGPYYGNFGADPSGVMFGTPVENVVPNDATAPSDTLPQPSP